MSAFLTTRLFAIMILGDNAFTEFDNIPRIRRRVFREIFIQTMVTVYLGSVQEKKTTIFKM